MNGLEGLLKELKKHFNGKFIITPDIKYEVIDKPLDIKRFKLGAFKIRELLKEGVLESSSSLDIDNKELNKRRKEVLKKANKCYYAKKDFIEIIHKGEASCLALSLMLKDSILVVDERTTRMLTEKPNNLRKLLENKLHTKVELKNNPDFVKNLKFLRSSELVYVAFKKGFVDLNDGPDLLDALLYGVKYKGCAISKEEIEKLKQL